MTHSHVSAWLRPAVLLTLGVGAVLVLTLVYYRAFAEFPCNSDCAGPFLSALDMTQGNWRLAGWWGGSDTFWTSDLALEAALIALLGNHPMIMVLAPAFDWAGVLALSAIATGAGVSRPRAALLPVAVIVALPVLRNNGIMYLIAYAPMHVGSILYILVMFLLVPAASAAGSAAVAALLALDLATVLGVAGDPLALVVGVAPVVAVAALAAVKHRDRRMALVLVNVLGAALLGRGVMALNQALGGIHLAPTPLAFVSFEDLPRNLYLTLKSLLILTGSDFFGKDLGSAALFLIRFPVLVAMGWALYAAAHRFVRHVRGASGAPEPDLLDQLLLAGAAIDILAGLVSGALVNITAARYFIPAVVFLAILTGRTLPAIRPIKAYGVLALAATVVLLGDEYAKTPPLRILVPPDVQELGDFLVRHRLTDGYASYWSASIVTVATRGAARVRQVTDAEGKVAPLRLVSKEDWYSGFGRRDRPFFIVVDKRPVSEALPQGPVTATFGPPSRRYDLPAYAIEVFEPRAP